MSTTVAFIAECQGSVTIDEQRAFLDPADHVVVAGKKSFNKLTEMLAQGGVELQRGDRVKLYDLSCITLSTTTLVRAMSTLLRKGIVIEIISSGIVVEPDADDKVRAMLDALDAHYRYLHGIKTHPADRRGRRRLLDPEQLPQIRAELEKPGVTATKVAASFGVARSTLFNFLDRYDQDRRFARDRKADQADAAPGDDAVPALVDGPTQPAP
ncbi:Hin recombinase [Sphingomonas bacterium]|uniref:Hin recombinase n=1 Tax=Sphingomonas bacterium TaxID=1895847 RepID=UPI0015752D8E|nr:Hin recombinase [Sphingomonas bacterium]